MELKESKILELMERCIELSLNCPENMRGSRTGALIYHDGEIVGEGWKQFIDHTRITQHAERISINDAYEKYDPKRAILFTTLEPCIKNRHRRNQIFKSCSELILESGIKTVVFGQKDFSSSQGRRNLSSEKYMQKRGVEVYSSMKLFRMVSESSANYTLKN